MILSPPLTARIVGVETGKQKSSKCGSISRKHKQIFISYSTRTSSWTNSEAYSKQRAGEGGRTSSSQ